MRFFLNLSYLGTQYSGWQRQTTAPSVQQTLEESISKVLGKLTTIHGCGRTDAGVHASTYYAHIEIDRTLDFDLVDRLNMVLPDDIAIKSLHPVVPHANAQRSAIQRTYVYHFHTEKNPAVHQISAYYRVDPLDMDKMLDAISVIARTKDFRSLCKQPDMHKSTLCRMDNISLVSTQSGHYKMTIRANRFLRNMIRHIAARVIEVGTGSLSFADFDRIVTDRKVFNFRHQKIAHPQGLFLSDVQYDQDLFL